MINEKNKSTPDGVKRSKRWEKNIVECKKLYTMPKPWFFYYKKLTELEYLVT